MKRFLVFATLTIASLLRATAQTSLDVIWEDIQAVKAQRDQANSQTLTTFLSSLQQASLGASSALDLYQRAGGSLPDAAPVRAHYEYETPSEKSAREAIDAQNYMAVAVVIQVHCGLMRQAAMLTLYPKKPEVQQQWLDWLKSIAPIYPQLAGHRALKDVPMRDSVVTKYLGFRNWGNDAPGGWAVHDIPQMYRDQVLEPLRHPIGPGTLDAWDAYIPMMQADEPDHDKWKQDVEPALEFDRGSDDFTVEPTMEKLAALDEIIKANPTSEHLDDWIARMETMINFYRKGGSTHAATPSPATTPPAPGASVPAATPGTL